VSTESTVSMQELELESAELLPTRETLGVKCYSSHGGGSYTSYAFGQFGNGNTAQSGFLDFSFLNGNLDNNQVNILSL
jgi:hypothetical protein